MMKLYFALLTFILSASSFAVTREIDPHMTSSEVFRIKSHHIVFEPETSNGLLLITIGGTGSVASEFKNIHGWAAKKGYTIWGIDYMNLVISTLCQKRTEVTCYDNYREEINFGTQVSPDVNVNKANSIYSRIEYLLKYLVKTSGEEKLKPFMLPDGTLNWSKVILAGHSQGAGHVAYLAKQFGVRRVIMVGGPHDYLSWGPPAWILNPTATARNRFFSFLHLKDYFGTYSQLGSSKALMKGEATEVLAIRDDIPQTSSAQIFMTDLPAADPHNSLLNVEFAQVWNFLIK